MCESAAARESRKCVVYMASVLVSSLLEHESSQAVGTHACTMRAKWGGGLHKFGVELDAFGSSMQRMHASMSTACLAHTVCEECMYQEGRSVRCSVSQTPTNG